jgi:iron complex transport system ATP-binding protein
MTATLEVRKLRYTADSACLLESVDFTAHAGSLTAIIGPNGAGKTTLLRAVAGLLPAHGTVRINGDLTATMRGKERAQRLAFVAADDTPTDDDLTVREVVAQGRYAHRRNAFDRSSAHDDIIDAALKDAELCGLQHRRLGTLSTGERRRAWIALGLAQETTVLLLDEPTANLDMHHAQRALRMMRRLADAGKTVLAVLHDLNEAAQFADMIALIDRARLVAFGPPHEVLTANRIARHYGVRVDVVTTTDGKPRIFACA